MKPEMEGFLWELSGLMERYGAEIETTDGPHGCVKITVANEKVTLYEWFEGSDLQEFIRKFR